LAPRHGRTLISSRHSAQGRGLLTAYECLNDHWFQTLHQARTAIGAWRQDYNQVRPHSSIGRIPPAKFAELHRRLAGDAAKQPANNEEIN